jgi:chemotaxis protein methyltransferase CheR
MSLALPPSLLEQISQFIAGRIGLHFPPERWGDLANGLASAARERRLDAEAYVRSLLSSPLTRREIEALACHLTVGETYFFRETKAFDVLEKQVLPQMIRRARGHGMRLRIWSAGCCTGEEPYSLAMLLDRMIPDLADWNVTILATDINPRFLEIASIGAYGEWSFRAIPPGIRERYFEAVPGAKMQVASHIRRMVTFSFLNLAQDPYPALATNTNAMDLVLCRNVLMYLTQEHAARIVQNLHAALVENGWLLVAPTETSQVFSRHFVPVSFPDAILYRKPVESAARLPHVPGASIADPPLRHAREQASGAESLSEEPAVAGAPAAVPVTAGTFAHGTPLAVDSLIAVARGLANRGELAQALSWCDRAVSSDRLNPAHRFLRAMVAQELGRLDEALKSLKQALYLDQDFVMAHFALGNIAKRLGRHELSRRHFRGVVSLLERLAPDASLPESAGLSAGRLMEIIRSTGNGEQGEA